MSKCPCSPDSYTLQHLGFWQYRSTGKIEENYECLKCHKYYRIVKGELKEILNFKGVSKNIHVPRDYKPIYRDNGKPKMTQDGTNINRNRSERYRNEKRSRIHRNNNSR